MLTGKKIKYFLQALGPIIFIYILFQIDYSLFRKALLNINIYFLIISIGLMMLQIVIKSFRWQIILSGLNINLKKKDSIRLYWLGTFMGVVTPGRLGELIKIYFLKNKGHNSFNSFISVLFDRIIDILILLILGFLIFLFFLEEIGLYVLIVSIVSILFLILIFLLIDNRSFLHKLFINFIKKINYFDFKGYNEFTFIKFWRSVKKIQKNKLFYLFTYVVFGWFLYFLSRYMIVASLNIELSFLQVSIISVLVVIVTMLPISISGIGTRDAVVIYLFGLFLINKELALLYSLIVLVTDLMILSLGLIPYMKELNLINKIKNK